MTQPAHSMSDPPYRRNAYAPGTRNGRERPLEVTSTSSSSYWTEGAIVIPPGQPPLHGRQAIRSYVSSSLQIPRFRDLLDYSHRECIT
jgi:hypothetical protein